MRKVFLRFRGLIFGSKYILTRSKRMLAWSGTGVIVMGVMVVAGLMWADAQREQAYAVDTFTGENTRKIDYPANGGGASGHHISQCENIFQPESSCWSLKTGSNPTDGKFEFNVPGDPAWTPGTKVRIRAYCLDPGKAFPQPNHNFTSSDWTVKRYDEGGGKYRYTFSIIISTSTTYPAQRVRLYGEKIVKIVPEENVQPVTTSTAYSASYKQGEAVADKIDLKVAGVDGEVMASSDAKDNWPSYKKDIDNDGDDETLYRSVKFCVYAIGPFSGKRTDNVPNVANAPPANTKYFEYLSGSSLADGYWGSKDKTWGSNSSVSHECVKSGTMTTPGTCATINGIECDGANFKVSFPGSERWLPGYYYFVSRIRGSMAGRKSVDECFASKYPTQYAGYAPGDSPTHDDDAFEDWLTTLSSSTSPSQETAVKVVAKCASSEFKADSDGEIIGQENEDMSESIIFNGTNYDFDTGIDVFNVKSKDWYSRFVDTNEEFEIKKFEPRVTSVASYDPVANTVIESLTSSAYVDGVANNAGWPNGVPVKVCVDLFGPYQNPKAVGETNTSGSYAATDLKTRVCTGDSGQPGHLLGPGLKVNLVVNTTGYTPGYYYFRATTDVDQPADAVWGDTNARILKWTAPSINPASPEKESFIIPFQPFTTSEVSSTRIGRPTFTDVITAHAAVSSAEANDGFDADDKNEYWLNNASVRVCVKAWRFDYKQPHGTTAITGKAPGANPEDYVAMECRYFTAPGVPLNFDFNTSGWKAGYYYFTEHISDSDVASLVQQGLVIGGFDSKLNPAGEHEEAILPFQPFSVSSSGPTTRVINESTEDAYDVLTPMAADSLAFANDYENDGNGGGRVSAATGDFNAVDRNPYWLWNYAGTGYIPVKYCVYVHGPYQVVPGKQIDYTNLNGVGTVTSGTDRSTRVCKNLTPKSTLEERTFTFAGSKDWEPGYYVFNTIVEQYGSGDSAQTAEASELIEGTWTSKYNSTSHGQQEYFIRQFQPFAESETQIDATSGMSNYDIYLDTRDDNLKDKFAFHAAKTLAEANNGYQSSVDRDEYWLKKSTAVTDYESVKFYVYLCGFYQYPQAKNVTFSDNATAGARCNRYSENLRKTTTITVRGPTRGDNPNNCSGTNVSADCIVDFGKTDKDGTAYEPGYYYWTIEMIKGDQSGNSGYYPPHPISDLIIGDWKSKFNPWSTDSFDHVGAEFSYVKFQPIAKSSMLGRKSENTSNGSLPDTINNGAIFDYLDPNSKEYSGCEEVRDGTAHYGQGTAELDKLPPEFMTCHNLIDRIYLGATDKFDIAGGGDPKSITSDNEAERYWPKKTGGTDYESINFRVKMYGPFADMDSADGAVDGDYQASSYTIVLPKAAGANNVGSAVAGANRTNVPQNIRKLQYQTVPDKNLQPAAQSCLITASFGPNWDKFKATGDNETQTPINSNGGDGYYKAILTQGDIDTECNNGVPTETEVSLRPGIYVSVVEIYSGYQSAQVDQWDQKQVVNTTNTNDNAQNNTLGGGDDNKSLRGGKVSDLILENFHSKYGDPQETLMVPLPFFLWTQRNSTQDYLIDGVSVMATDSYWLGGLRGTYYGDDDNDGTGEQKVRYDIMGKKIQGHNTDENSEQDKDVPYDYSYKGDNGYFKGDNTLDYKLEAKLWGPYANMPDSNVNSNYCNGTPYWSQNIEAKDRTDAEQHTTGTTIDVGSATKGWYVFTWHYAGDSRIAPFTTDCSDGDEMFEIDDSKEPRIQTFIKAAKKQAPTVITDEVIVEGKPIDKGSIVKLSLYKRRSGTNVNDHELDQQICVVRFKIDEAGTYNTSEYVDKNGRVQSGMGSGSCYADSGGFYYWREEFLKPDKIDNTIIDDDEDDTNNQPYVLPKDGGPGEEITLDQDKPKVETSADPTTQVGSPFSDIAIVTIPKGDKHDYFLYFEAYGPVDNGNVICSSSNLLFTTKDNKIKVDKSGSYTSPTTSAKTPGIVYWIEHLEDEGGNPVADGSCGAHNEITRVVPPVNPPTPSTPYEFTPFMPSAGFITRQVGKIVALGAITVLGAWQLTNRRSWLLRRW